MPAVTVQNLSGLSERELNAYTVVGFDDLFEKLEIANALMATGYTKENWSAVKQVISSAVGVLSSDMSVDLPEAA